VNAAAVGILLNISRQGPQPTEQERPEQLEEPKDASDAEPTEVVIP
jgi:hypothetical protein